MNITTPTGTVNLDGTLLRSILHAPPSVPNPPVLISSTSTDSGNVVHEVSIAEWPENADVLYVEVQGSNPDGPELPFVEVGVISPGDLRYSHEAAENAVFRLRFKASNENGNPVSSILSFG